MSADAETIGIVTDVGQIAQAAAAAFKAFDDLFMVFNSPSMLEARKNADIQSILLKMDEDLHAAKKSGNILIIDKEASG